MKKIVKNQIANKQPLVSVLVLNYNGVKFLKKCLPSLLNQSYQNLEIIVLDNNSIDESINCIKKINHKIKIIQNKDNFGYAKANNIGAKSAKGTFLLFLNNDTELLKDTIKNLVSNYQNNSIIGPEQTISSLSKQKNDNSFNKVLNTGMDIFGYPYANQNQNKTKAFYIDGAALFIKKLDFIKIGMFDEKHFIFFEDLDLCWRAQLLGYQIKPCSKAKLYHYSGGTVTGAAKKGKKYHSSYLRRYLNEKNLIRNILKNYGFPLHLIILIMIILMHIPEMLLLILIGEGKAAECYLNAYKWNLANLEDTWQARKKIQSTRIINDWQILKKVHWGLPKFAILLKYGLPKFS